MRCGLVLLLVPMLGGQCDGQEFTWDNQEYIWARANTTVAEDSVIVIRGRVLDTVVLGGQRLVFVESACTSFADWPWNTECLESRITLRLVDRIEYDIVGWSEPGDRRTPVRDTTVFQTSWTCCNE